MCDKKVELCVRSWVLGVYMCVCVGLFKIDCSVVFFFVFFGIFWFLGFVCVLV